jgi:hypothetical protein
VVAGVALRVVLAVQVVLAVAGQEQLVLVLMQPDTALAVVAAVVEAAMGQRASSSFGTQYEQSTSQ